MLGYSLLGSGNGALVSCAITDGGRQLDGLDKISIYWSVLSRILGCIWVVTRWALIESMSLCVVYDTENRWRSRSIPSEWLQRFWWRLINFFAVRQFVQGFAHDLARCWVKVHLPGLSLPHRESLSRACRAICQIIEIERIVRHVRNLDELAAFVYRTYRWMSRGWL